MIENWDPTYCNNPAQLFTNSNLQKLPQWASISIELICLLIMYLFQRMKNQYRYFDKQSEFSWKMQRVLLVLSFIDNCVVMFNVWLL